MFGPIFVEGLRQIAFDLLGRQEREHGSARCAGMEWNATPYPNAAP
ncbi:MAG: hypothetical protein M5T61_09975 [Acidimicrobiia bacterium]|nr:hypothetical protein [Acidimicrobiia bacterium]